MGRKYEEYIKMGCKPYLDKVTDKAKHAYNIVEQIIMTNSSLSLVENFYFGRFKQEACCRKPDLDIYPILSPISFRTVARNTSIRTRFKSLTALLLNKLEKIKRVAYLVAGAYVWEINPERKAMAKKQLRKL